MPPDAIQPLQLAILWLSAAAFAATFFFGWRHLRTASIANAPTQPDRARLGSAARSAFITGLVLALALAAWRTFTYDRAAGLIPLHNFFDSFLFLGLLLAALGLYFRFTQHLRSLAFFLVPMIALVFLVGGILSLLYAQSFDYHSAVNVVHVTSVMIGSACFAAGAAGGLVYLLADRQLRRKGLAAARRIRFPALASLEKFNQFTIFLGFPLLTIAMITGLSEAQKLTAAGSSTVSQTVISSSANTQISATPGHNPGTKEVITGEPGSTGGSGGGAGGGVLGVSIKIVLAVAAWVIYALLLHLPIAPSFRGRGAAWLSIVGFAVLLSVFVAVRWSAPAS